MSLLIGRKTSQEKHKKNECQQTLDYKSLLVKICHSPPSSHSNAALLELLSTQAAPCVARKEIREEALK